MRRPNKAGGSDARQKIKQFAEVARRELDTDEIKELVRRTPGIEPEDRIIAYHFLADDMCDMDISVAEGVYCSRSSVGRHLCNVIPLIEYRFNLDKAKAGA